MRAVIEAAVTPKIVRYMGHRSYSTPGDLVSMVRRVWYEQHILSTSRTKWLHSYAVSRHAFGEPTARSLDIRRTSAPV